MHKSFSQLASGAPRDAVKRSERLAHGYLATELMLREQGVQQTIVVFGGTQVIERNVEVTADKPDYYGIAREFGAIVGRSGHGPDDCRLTLMTGGGPGIMEAANRGASDVGAKSIGLNIRLPSEQFPNPYITKELSFDFHYFAVRKLHFVLRAKALVVFPGGFGTLDELFETLNLVKTGKVRPLPIVLVGEQFWRRVFDPAFLVAEGVIDPEDCDLFWFVETAEQAWSSILNWHRAAGMPLLCETELCM